MRIPAAIPAAAVVAGAVLGTWGGGAPVAGLAFLLAAIPLSLYAFLARRLLLFLLSVVLVFGAGAWSLARRAESDAAAPPLRRALAAAVGSGPVWLEGPLRDDAAPGTGGVVLTLNVERWEYGEARGRVPGGVRLTVAGAMAPGLATTWCAGRRVRLPALLRVPGRYQDPGVPDGRLALARRGVALAGGVKSGALVEVVARGGWVSELAARIRAFARRAAHRHIGRLAAQSEAIVVAILIGDRVGIDPDVERQLQEAGTYHVMAISGGNIAILAGVVLWLLRLAGAGHRVGSWVTIFVLAGYAEVVGGGASVVRATLMAVIYLVARQADHAGAPLNSLAVSAAVLLVASPSSIADVGCWLTFGATLGIMLGTVHTWSRLPTRPWLRVPAALLLTSLFAELTLFPVSAHAFSRVTFAGLALNFIAIPMMTVAQIAGMLAVCSSAVSVHAADAAGYVAHLGATGLVGSARLVSVAPWLTYRLPPPHWLVIAAYYAAWGGWFATRRPARGPRAPGREAGVPAVAFGETRVRRLTRRTSAAAIVSFGLWILVEPVTLVVPGVKDRLRIAVIDVGHGDSVLVQLPDRRSLLVDTGGTTSPGSFDVGARVVAPVLWALGTRRLDVLVLSHGDPDHAGGAASILRDFRPREVWEGIPIPSLPLEQALRAQAAARRIPWTEHRAGETARFGEVLLAIHHPPPPDWERQRPRNDDSLVIELRYRGVSVVLSGDIGRDVERGLLAAVSPAAFRAVKIPHHGSATSSSPAFVDALQARVAILSAGSTTRVSDAVLGRYASAGAAMYRTDRDGLITLETAGRGVVVSTFTGRTDVFTR